MKKNEQRKSSTFGFFSFFLSSFVGFLVFFLIFCVYVISFVYGLKERVLAYLEVKGMTLFRAPVL